MPSTVGAAGNPLRTPMINRLIRYLLPPLQMYSVPRRISAEYQRAQMSAEEQLIMMAGLARDPADARRVYQALERQHGDGVYEHLQLQLMRQRGQTVRQRWLTLIRTILGEGEPRQMTRRRHVEPIVYIKYTHKDQGE